MAKKTFEGKDADVHWDGKLCIHIGECGRDSSELFVGGRKPWCQPDLVTIGSAKDVIDRCPTGALTLTPKDGTEAETPDSENTISVMYNGPLYVRGDLQIDGAGAAPDGVRYRAALCRCGQSKNKPFCDNAHDEAGFRDFGAVGQSSENDQTGGPLTVKRAKNGPLLLSGNVTIRAASGRVAWRGTKAALCRCGQSKNKPFCDGAHSKVGFEAD